jgi:hypothetical protein
MRIDFPVIVFTKEGHMLSDPDWKNLTTLSHKAWRQGVYNGLTIVDSSGLGYTVNAANKVGYPGFLFGYSLLKERAVKVNLAFETDPRPFPLEELKTRVHNSIRVARHFWMAADMKRLLTAIKDASSHKEIIELILGQR